METSKKQCKVCEYLSRLQQCAEASYTNGEHAVRTAYYRKLANLSFQRIVSVPKLSALYPCTTDHKHMAIAFRRNTRIIREQELNRLRAEIASGRVENKKSLGQLKRKLRELEEKYST